LPSDDGCGKELTDWLALVKPKTPSPVKPGTPAVSKPGITLDQLPSDCRAVLANGSEGLIPAPPLAAKAAAGSKTATPAKVDKNGATTK
jgi:hypothetical protein